MANVPITWRPLTQWPSGRKRAPSRTHAPFKAKHDDTLELLQRELATIRAKSVVVQCDVETEHEMRRDGGGLRVDARVKTPAVVLSFERDGKPIVVATDRFWHWSDNLRAIALGLEALRKLERYHIAEAGDQYRGWQALPASTTTAFTTEHAAAFLRRHVTGEIGDVLRDVDHARRAVRFVAAKLHPDAGGSTSDFQLVQEAKRVLSAHFGVSL